MPGSPTLFTRLRPLSGEYEIVSLGARDPSHSFTRTNKYKTRARLPPALRILLEAYLSTPVPHSTPPIHRAISGATPSAVMKNQVAILPFLVHAITSTNAQSMTCGTGVAGYGYVLTSPESLRNIASPTHQNPRIRSFVPQHNGSLRYYHDGSGGDLVL